MRLGILPEQGGSIANLRRTGQDTRFIDQYLKRYAREFEEVHYFSYARESLDRPVADNFHLHPNPGVHRWLYAFLLPWVQRRDLRRCSVFRIMQATGAIPAWLARKAWGIPFVLTYGYHYSKELRGQGRRFRARLFDRRARWALRTADGIIVTTPALEEYARAFAPNDRIALIPNSVNTDLFSPEGPAVEKPPSRFRLLSIGNLTSNKNHIAIVEAVNRLDREDVDIVVLGRGDEKEHLRRLASDLSIHLDLPGIVPNENLPQWLRSAALYLIPSHSEGHPKSLLEAMSCALPCIGNDAPGIRDVLTDGETGRLCAPDTESLAQAIDELLSNGDLARRLGENARRFVLENYSAEVVMAREIEFLKKVATQRGR